MNATVPPAARDERFCPDCGTVHAVTEPQCPHCRLSLTWLDRVSNDFRSALRVDANEPGCRVALRIDWPGSHFETQTPVGTPVELTAGAAGRVAIDVDESGTTCNVVVGDAGETAAMRLPGETHCRGVRIAARRVVTASAETPPDLRPHSTEYVLGAAAKSAIVLGRVESDPAVPALPSQMIAPRHAVVAWSIDTSLEDGRVRSYWIAAVGQALVFVNRRPVRACRLSSGDLLQIGPFGCVVNVEDGHLVPAVPIVGAKVRMEGVAVGGRFGPIDVEIAPGTLVAVVGSSGAGKSTLVRAIVDGPSIGRTGRVVVDDRDVDADPAWFQSLLGYVPQSSILHGELTVREALTCLCRLRRSQAKNADLARLLRAVDVPQTRWDAPCRELSGGEDKRMRTAAELLHDPRLLLLDEPASGLDPQRESALLRLLRTLADRGCTVVVVTHNWTNLGHFDRVVGIDGGKVASDGPPKDFDGFRSRERSESAPSESRPASWREVATKLAIEARSWFATGSERWKRSRSRTASPSMHSIWSSLSKRVSQRLRDDAAQFRELLGREVRRLARDWVYRLAVPLIVLPLFFAVTLAIGVPAGERPLLGFLAILSCIWMGSSLALASIVGERRIVDHERRLFLRVGPYVAAKVAPLWAIGLLQTAIFLAALLGLRRLLFWSVRTDSTFLEPFGVLGSLALVSLAAVGLGLFVSALAGSHPPLANFLLPLLMMAQIVFSVHVSGNAGDPLHEAYEDFSIGRKPEDESRSSSLVRRASGMSNLTISRYGDVALRSFAYWHDAVELQESHNYRSHRRWALTILLAMTLASPVAAAATLLVQERIAARRASVRVRSSSMIGDSTTPPDRTAADDQGVASGTATRAFAVHGDHRGETCE